VNRCVPEVDRTCHICGAVFRFRTSFDPPHGFTHSPETCPACDAPVRHSYPADIGRTKDLLANHRRGRAREFLERECRMPEEVDAYLEIVRTLRPRIPPKLDAAAANVKQALLEHRRKHLAIRTSRA